MVGRGGKKDEEKRSASSEVRQVRSAQGRKDGGWGMEMGSGSGKRTVDGLGAKGRDGKGGL